MTIGGHTLDSERPLIGTTERKVSGSAKYNILCEQICSSLLYLKTNSETMARNFKFFFRHAALYPLFREKENYLQVKKIRIKIYIFYSLS